MKKIAHICLSCFYVDNMGYQENILPKKHKQQGYNVEIITSPLTFGPDGKSSIRRIGTYINENDIPVVVLPFVKWMGKYAQYLHYVSGLLDELKRFKPDIIFCHGTSFLSIFDLKWYCKHYDTVLYCDCHSDYYNTPTKKGKYLFINGIFWPFIARSISNVCKKAWGTTPARCDYLSKIYKYPDGIIDLLVMGGDEDFIHIENRASLRERLYKIYNISNDTFLVCTGGKIGEEKRIVELIEAVESLDANIHLIVFGTVSRGFENEFNKALEKTEKITFFGWANQQQIYDFFVASDLAFFPGTHSVLWEQAVACGTPAVFRRREMMTHVDVGGNCLFLDRPYVEDIKNVLQYLLKSKEVYKAMKSNAIEKGMPYFSYYSIAKRAIEDE